MCEPSKIAALNLSSEGVDELSCGGGVIAGVAGGAGGGGEGVADRPLAAGEGLEDLDCLSIGSGPSDIRVMRQHIAAFLRDRSAATAVEYGLITALVMLAIVVGITAAGTQMNTMFGNLAAVLQASPAN